MHETIDFYDKDGSIKNFDEIVNQLKGIYDNIASEKEEDGLLEMLSEPATDIYSPDMITVLEKYKFLDRKIYLTTEIDDRTGREILEKIQFWNADDEVAKVPIEERNPIQIYIDTPGGQLTTTFLIVDAISSSRTPVHTIVTGTAYSGGFLIAIAGHKRYAFENATFLFHEGGSEMFGDSRKVLQQAKFYESQLKKIEKLVLCNTGITSETYEKHRKDDWYFDTEKAIKLGVIDKVATYVDGGNENE